MTDEGEEEGGYLVQRMIALRAPLRNAGAVWEEKGEIEDLIGAAVCSGIEAIISSFTIGVIAGIPGMYAVCGLSLIYG